MLPHNAQRTAIHRRTPSEPARLFLSQKRLYGRVLDYGCGHGADLAYYCAHDLAADGYDPAWRPHTTLAPASYDVVTCVYVLNILETPAERLAVLAHIRALLRPGGRLLLAVRSIKDTKDLQGTSLGDGLVTRTYTFQHGFSAPEAKELVLRAGFEWVRLLTAQPLTLQAMTP